MSDQQSAEQGAWRAAMLEVVGEIVENTAFSEVRESATPPVYDDLARGCALRVLAPIQGEFSLFMEGELLTDLTRLVYGSPTSGIDSGLEDDFLAELLNTIAGRFLAAILPPEQGFDLGLPNRKSGPMDYGSPTPCLRWDFTVDDRPFTLLLQGEIILSLPEQQAESARNN